MDAIHQVLDYADGVNLIRDDIKTIERKQDPEANI